MLRFLLSTLVVLINLGLYLQAQTDEQDLVNACQGLVTAKYRQWRFVPVMPAVAEFAKSRNVNPTIIFGDFDGDSRKDVALLVQDGPVPATDYPERLDSLHIAVCMNMRATRKLYLIDKPYCGDGIQIAPKGGRYYDYETETDGSYKRDGVHAYCFEKAGATYEFDKGSFRKIVDSD